MQTSEERSMLTLSIRRPEIYETFKTLRRINIMDDLIFWVNY